MNKPLKQHGGHTTGLRDDLSAGRGPVFEIRRALNEADKTKGGIGWSQRRLADAAGCGLSTICRAETLGVWPRSRAVQAALKTLARSVGLKL